MLKGETEDFAVSDHLEAGHCDITAITMNERICPVELFLDR
jgi:hypothetical protein